MKSPVEEQRLHRLLVSAREDERRRWARELHDETLQSLGALRLQLSAARRSDEVEALRAALDGAVHELGREIANLRSLITELRPAALDELGLQSALETLFERTQAVYGLEMRAHVWLDGAEPSRLDPELETTVYRVIQEALSNAARHARARRVDVEVYERRGEILVTVADDGGGFDPKASAAGFGLSGMQERVALVGGWLELQSSEQGTAVLARLPAVRERIVPRAHRPEGSNVAGRRVCPRPAALRDGAPRLIH